MATMNMEDWGWNPRECECASHSDECGCEHCHECRQHDWTMWNIYPPCTGCEEAMLEWWRQEIEEAA